MRKVKIITDSTSDLNAELHARYDLTVIPLNVQLGNDSYRDGVDINPSMISDYVAKTKILPKTSAPSVLEYENLFRKPLEEDMDVVFIGIGSKMSAAYMSAKLAAENVDPTRIHVVDSLNLSTGTGLLVCKAGDMMLAGLPAKEIAENITALAPKVRASFVVDTLDYLYMGGRCTSLENIAAGILKLRPRIVVTDGQAVSAQKYRGKFEKCLDGYIKDTVAEMTNFDKTRVFVTRAITQDPALGEGDSQKAVEEVKKTSPEEILQTNAGCVIFSHCGPRTIGILYIDN